LLDILASAGEFKLRPLLVFLPASCQYVTTSVGGFRCYPDLSSRNQGTSKYSRQAWTNSPHLHTAIT
jgi:hypothetical protein